MVFESKSLNHENIESTLYDTVVSSKISSLEMISNLTGINEEIVYDTIESLVEVGSLEGSFTDDKKRFFLSDVKTSDAPILDNHDTGLEMKSADTKSAKAVALLGVVMLVFGQILRGLVAVHTGMESAGTAIFLIGLVVLFTGWLQFSRLNPVSTI
ncbi:MAG: hypothetical protein ACTSYJ_02265 [Candidatus Thorarchaeota archaeon]